MLMTILFIELFLQIFVTQFFSLEIVLMQFFSRNKIFLHMLTQFLI